MLDIGQRGPIPAIENPSPAQFTRMLERHGEVRGLIDKHGHNYIWNAFAIEHHAAAIRLGVEAAAGYIAKVPLRGDSKIIFESYLWDDNDTPLIAYPQFLTMIRGLTDITYQ